MKYINEETKELVISAEENKKIMDAGIILHDIGMELMLNKYYLKGEFPELWHSGYELTTIGLRFAELADNQKLTVYHKE